MSFMNPHLISPWPSWLGLSRSCSTRYERGGVGRKALTAKWLSNAAKIRATKGSEWIDIHKDDLSAVCGDLLAARRALREIQRHAQKFDLLPGVVKFAEIAARALGTRAPQKGKVRRGR
jgi:hypothetical protein